MNVITQEHGENWTLYNGDSAEVLTGIPADSLDLSVYSPPFESLFTYSASERDLGNCRTPDQFFSQYAFIVRELLRVIKPGRLSCVHSADIPALQMKDGYIGLRDFPGEVIRIHEQEGWVFVGRVCIDKNPQSLALRTHSKALLFAQMEKDATESRPGFPDQILIFKKDGKSMIPVRPVKNGELSRMDWILWARPIWYAADYEPGSFDKESAEKTQKSGHNSEHGIRETDTLQFTTARDKDDEKHICPLQLGTIERCVKLYSNPGEVVLSPFAGIGSEVYQAVKFGRKGIGIELKSSYYRVAVKNLKSVESTRRDLFS